MKVSLRTAVKEFAPHLAAAGLWLWPLVIRPNSIGFWRGGAYSDLVISHIPSAILLHRGIFEAGRVPLWNPSILSGIPFAADPLSGMWYLPNWAAALFPAAVTFNLLFGLHLAWAGWGGARLAKAEGVEGRGALVSGLALAGAPKLIGHIGLGHLGFVEAVCWTPWLLLAVRHATDSLSRGRRPLLRTSALLGVILGVIFLADPRWSIPATMGGAAYSAIIIARSHKMGGKGVSVKHVAGGATAAGLFALGTASGLALPLWEFLRLSTRASMTVGERAALSLPWDRLAGFVTPEYGGWPEWLAYPGIAVLVLAVLAFVGSKARALFWWGMALGGCMLALGPGLPIFALADSFIPGASFLRVPARFLLLTSLSLAILAGFGLKALVEAGRDARSRRQALRIGFVAASSIILIAASRILTTDGPSIFHIQGYAAIVFACLASAWLYLMVTGTIGARIGAAGWVLLVCADLAIMASVSLRIVPMDRVHADREALAASVAREAGGGRVLSPSYSLRQPSAVIAGLELADGINPLQLTSYRDFMSKTLGFSSESYSVSLPPFPNGDPSTAWPVSLDTNRLGLLNVTRVVSEFPLQADGLVLDTSGQEAFVYINLHSRPRAWMQASPQATQSWTPVERIDLSIDAVHIRARGPGTLVISQVSYPGWVAEIDGNRVPITMIHGVILSMDVPTGDHDVDLNFRPASVYVGGAVMLLTLIGLVVVWARR